MQMVSNTHNNNYGSEAPGAGASGGGNGNNEPHPPPPPPVTQETFFAQFLGSQRNVEHSQWNMEEILCAIANNTHRGDNQGGNEVN
jgi:hypothetical protein